MFAPDQTKKKPVLVQDLLVAQRLSNLSQTGSMLPRLRLAATAGALRAARAKLERLEQFQIRTSNKLGWAPAHPR